MGSGQPLFVTFFMAGALIFLIGLVLKVSFYWRGQWDRWAFLGGAFSTLFSARIGTFIKIIFLDGILQRRLFSQDKLRWLMKVLIMIGYPGILIAGHLKVEAMPQFEKLPHLLRFLYAPFCDFYYFRDITASSISFSDALFGVFFDLFGAMILTGEFIAIYRRFVARAATFKTSAPDIIAVNLLGGWFVLRFFCEATSILAYSIPDPLARYWFVSFGLSKVIGHLGLPWASLNYPLWSISGLFLGMLVAFIPFNRKLWHIVTIPVVMFINLMPDEAFKPGERKRDFPLSIRDLISLDSCVKCGSCVDVCPVYGQTQQLETTMGGFISNFKSFIGKAYGLSAAASGAPKAKGVPKEYSEHAYCCTLCGRCTTVCPASIYTKKLRMAVRGFMVEKGEYPPMIDRLAENLIRVHNIVGEPNEDRALWAQALGDAPDAGFQKEKAKVVYFVGCVASYYPMTKKIPQAFVQVLGKAGVDFTILGGEEWCCGWPLMAAGMEKDTVSSIRHNLERLKAKGAEKAIFACPSCYHMWREHYKADVEIFHSTEFIMALIEEGRIRFKEKKVRVTYHDPCDLGRGSGVYEAPRQILRSMPGVDLAEMEGNREQCKCCGGGGDLEMVRPDLSAAMGQVKIEEIKATGADLVVTACQQCIRSILTTARRKKIPLSAMDIIEFVNANMDE